MFYEKDREVNKNVSENGHRISGKKSSEGGRGNPKTASPAAIERYLNGIKFPASREDLINRAKDNRAPNDVLTVLEKFEDQDYNSVIDVSKTYKVVNS